MRYSPQDFAIAYVTVISSAEKIFVSRAGVKQGTQVCNADYPVFRLADTYLMLAECQLNGVECNGKLYFP